MKKIFFAVFLSSITIGVFANTKPTKLKIEKSLSLSAKVINITVTVGGYTIHIEGTVDYSIWTKKTTIDATITITGNGQNLSLPFHYSGPLSQGQLNAVFDGFPTDQEISDFVVSCIDFNTMTIVYPGGSGS